MKSYPNQANLPPEQNVVEGLLQKQIIINVPQAKEESVISQISIGLAIMIIGAVFLRYINKQKSKPTS